MKITFATSILISFVILIQIHSAISTGETQPISSSLLQRLFNQPGNLQRVQDLLNLSPAEAHQKLQLYLRTQLSEDMKSLLKQVVESPNKIRPPLEPWLSKLPPLPLNDESILYRVVGKPLWNLGSGLGYWGLKLVGVGIQSFGEAIQIFNDSAKESISGYYGKSNEPYGESALDKINSQLDVVKNFGGTVLNNGENGIQNVRTRRQFNAGAGMNTNTNTNTNTKANTNTEQVHASGST